MRMIKIYSHVGRAHNPMGAPVLTVQVNLPSLPCCLLSVKKVHDTVMHGSKAVVTTDMWATGLIFSTCDNNNDKLYLQSTSTSKLNYGVLFMARSR